MALVKQQTIPPEWAELYRATLGLTRPNANPGGGPVGFDDIVEGKFPTHLEPPHIPSMEQLQQRTYFKICSDCFNLAPENERRAYWRLSTGTGLEYRNFYLQETIPAAIKGKTCNDWRRPTAISLMSEWGYKMGTVDIYIPDIGPRSLDYEITLDPADGASGILECCSGVYSMIHRWWNSNDSPPHPECSVLETWDPAVQTDYLGVINVPAIPAQQNFLYRYVDFVRDATTFGQTVLWIYETDQPGDSRSGYLFD